MTFNRKVAKGTEPSRASKRALMCTTAGLFLACVPGALHAETNNELAAEIKALKAQIREMRAAISETRSETRRTSAKVRSVAVRRTPETVVAPAPLAAGYPALPPGAVPAFVTADKKFQFGAITITPGGFLAGESVYRTRTVNSDIATNFGSTPFANSPLGHVGEFRPSARQSRIALLVEGAITPTFLTAGYAELDFVSAAPTANANQTNSYTPRIRHLYAQLDNNDYGMHVLAGQNWSLLTLNSKGITPRNEVTPITIDSNQHVGSIYARQPQIRLAKDFNKRLWAALSVEESEGLINPNCNNPAGGTVFTGSTGSLTPNPANAGIANPGVGNAVTNITCGFTGNGANANTTNFTLNHYPDVIGKLAYEARLGDRDIHLETFGIYTALSTRVQYLTPEGNNSYANRDTSGYGAGAGIIVPVLPRRLDFQANAIYGRGINRYGPGQLQASTFNADGSLKATPGIIGLVGVTLHATPAIDLYAYGGVERLSRSYFQNPTAAGANPTYVGFGTPAIDNSTCAIEQSAAATCNGTTHTLWEVSGGFWDKIYKGSFGEVRGGVQYSYLQRELFNQPGNFTPKTNNHMIFTSLRYYPFQ